MYKYINVYRVYQDNIALVRAYLLSFLLFLAMIYKLLKLCNSDFMAVKVLRIT